MVICHAQKCYQTVTINDHKWASLYIQEVYVYLIEGNGSSRMGFKMLKCNNCAARVDVLAHQIRESVEVAVCLDCADRFYQDQLTKQLIAAEKAVA